MGSRPDPPRAHVPELLDRGRTTLVVVDVQEAFRGRIPDLDAVVGAARLLLSGCRLLGVPVVVTEQYPRGLGHTVEELAEVVGDAPVLEKRAFSAARAAGFADCVTTPQVLLCGIEAHVCVHGTATDLLLGGSSVHLALDAIASQRAVDREAGVARMLADGAHASTAETALFELLGSADDPAFRAVSALLKESSAGVGAR
jgi:nicotinamidase-related amidase